MAMRCARVRESFTQHWASNQPKSNSTKCHTHIHVNVFVHCERHRAMCLVCIMAFQTYRRNIQSTGNDLKDSEPKGFTNWASSHSHRVFFLFSSLLVRFQSSPTILHSDASLYPSWNTESHCSTTNKDNARIHISVCILVSHVVWRMCMVDRSKFMEQLFWHCILWTLHGGAEKLSPLCPLMRL